MSPSSKLAFMRHGFAMAVGTAAGVTSGLVGWGGAQVMIPSMTLPIPLASYSQLSATGISLSSLSVSSVASGYQFWMDKQVDIPLALGIGLPALASARAGSLFARRLSGDALQLFFNGFSLLLIPAHFWIQRRRSATSAARDSNHNAVMGGQDDDRAPVEEITFDDMYSTTKLGETANASRSHGIDRCQKTDAASDDNDVARRMFDNPLMLQHASFGLFSGVVSALMGVGGLPLTMSYLTVSTDLPHHEVQGTAVVALIPSIMMSAASRMSVVPPSAAACVAVGAFGGGLGGARVALGLSEAQLRYLFMGSLCLFGGINMVGAARNMQRICSNSKRL